MESARSGKQISEIVSEALEQYLRGGDHVSRGLDLVGESWGVIKIGHGRLKRVLEDDGLLDT